MGSTPLVFDLSTMPPGRMTFPRIVGGSYEGGSALSGVTLASDITGGGFLAVDYAEIQLSNTKRDRILAFSRLMVALQGDECVPVPLAKVAGSKKLVPPDHPWVQTARLVSTCAAYL